MSLRDEINSDMQEIEGDLAGENQFTDRGTSYPCTPGEITDDETLELGGLNTKLNSVIIVRKNVYGATALPKKKSRITYKSEAMRIGYIKIDPTGVFMKLYLEDPNSGI